MKCHGFIIITAFIINKGAVVMNRALWVCDVFMRCSYRDAVSVTESLHYSRRWRLQNLTRQSHSTVCRVSTKILHLHTQTHNISTKHLHCKKIHTCMSSVFTVQIVMFVHLSSMTFNSIRWTHRRSHHTITCANLMDPILNGMQTCFWPITSSPAVLHVCFIPESAVRPPVQERWDV